MRGVILFCCRIECVDDEEDDDDDEDDDDEDEQDEVRRFSMEKLGFLMTGVAVDEDVDEAQDDMLDELLSFRRRNGRKRLVNGNKFDNIKKGTTQIMCCDR